MSSLPTVPLARRSLHEQAAEAVREMIVSGQLGDGERLVEAELCARLGISRTPLREAMRLLEAEGLVMLSPHRGASVAVLTAEETGDLFQLLAELEGFAVRLALPRLSDPAMDRLRRTHERMLRLWHAGRPRECFEADQSIHLQLIEASGSAVLAATRDGLMLRARRGRYRAFFNEERWREAMGEHDALMDAITRRASEAEELMRQHVLNTGRTLCRALLEGDPGDASNQNDPISMKAGIMKGRETT